MAPDRGWTPAYVPVLFFCQARLKRSCLRRLPGKRLISAAAALKCAGIPHEDAIIPVAEAFPGRPGSLGAAEVEPEGEKTWRRPTSPCSNCSRPERISATRPTAGTPR